MFQHIFQSSPIAIIIVDRSNGRYVDLNPAAEQLLGSSRAELLGPAQAAWEQILMPAARDALLQLLAEQGRVVEYACTLTTRAGTPRECLLSIESLELDGQAYALTQLVDVTAQNAARIALQQASTRLQILADASAAFAADGMDEGALLDTLVQRTSEAFGCGCFIRMRQGDDPWLRVVAGHDSDPATLERLEAFARQADVHIDSPHPAALVVRSGQPQLTPAIDLEALHALLPPNFWPAFEHMPIHSEIIAPLRVQGQTVGCLILLRHTPGQPAFTQDDLAIAQDLADRAGLAIANARLYRDVQAAQREAQQAHAQLNALITSLPTGVGYFDRDVRYQLVNPALARINDRPPADHIGQAVSAIVPELAAQIEPLLRQVLETGVTLSNLEMPGEPHPSGQGFYTWLVSYFPVPGAEGEIAGVGVTLTDITASKEAELRLRQSEARFATIFECSSIALGIMRLRDSRFTDVNAASLSLYGYPREAFIGHTALELGIWADPEQRQYAMQQLLAHQRITSFEAVIRTASGEARPVLLSAEVVSIHNEPHILTQVIDISALKQAQHDLQELNRTLEERVEQRTAEVQDLYDHAPTGYYSTNADGQIVRMNQTLLGWLGYSHAEVLGRMGVEFLAPETRETFVAQIPGFKQRSQVQGLDARLLRKDGSSFPVLLSVTSVYAADGTYLSNRATVFDNTERRQAEEALRESEAQNRLLFEESPAAMALFDQHDRIVRANRAFAQLVGYPIEHLRAQPVDALGLLSPAQLTQLTADVAPTLKHGPGFAEAVVRFTRANGELQVVELRTFALTINGQWHSLAAIRDITRDRQTEETLRRANAELARAARAKDEFLANMSHELRTPINAILAYSESLQDGIYDSLNARQRGAVDAVEGAGRHLLSLINDILDLAKVEAGRLDLQIRPVSVQEVCQASLLFVREQALKKRMHLSFELSDHAATLDVDPVRLKQMLVNLLSNAVKFTPDGGAVRLEVTIDSASGVAQFVVSDSGIGIAPEDLGRLFLPFSQIDAALDRAYEGTGLGLALVRRLAELHGGSVSVESDVGAGSRFSIALPYRAPLQAPPPGAEGLPPGAAGHAPVKEGALRGWILLAEDNPANSGALSDYLQARGYTVAIARNGREALARADEVQPQLILMDIQMPEMDGIEAIRRLRAQPAHTATPIIALTALAMPGDQERCLAAGATMYLTKPVGLRDLATTIQRLIER